MKTFKTPLQIWAGELKARLEHWVEGYDKTLMPEKDSMDDGRSFDVNKIKAIAKKELAESLIRHIDSTVDL